MPYTIIVSDYLYSGWYQYSPFEARKPESEGYEMLGTFSQGTNWEKVFALGNKINKNLEMTEQNILDDIAIFRKQKNTR